MDKSVALYKLDSSYHGCLDGAPSPRLPQRQETRRAFQMTSAENWLQVNVAGPPVKASVPIWNTGTRVGISAIKTL